MRAVPVDLIRTIAIVGVITLYAASEAIAPQVMNQTEVYRWWIGYSILGVFLLSVKVRRSILLGLMTIGLVMTAIGTYMIVATVGGPHTYFFQDYSVQQ